MIPTKKVKQINGIIIWENDYNFCISFKKYIYRIHIGLCQVTGKLCLIPDNNNKDLDNHFPETIKLYVMSFGNLYNVEGTTKLFTKESGTIQLINTISTPIETESECQKFFDFTSLKYKKKLAKYLDGKDTKFAIEFMNMYKKDINGKEKQKM